MKQRAQVVRGIGMAVGLSVVLVLTACGGGGGGGAEPANATANDGAVGGGSSSGQSATPSNAIAGGGDTASLPQVADDTAASDSGGAASNANTASNNNNAAANATPTVVDASSVAISGTAATGAAMAQAAVAFKCQSKTYQTQTDASGGYRQGVPRSELPCFIRVQSAAGAQLHSVALTADTAVTANVTPVTELMLAAALVQLPRTAFDTAKQPDGQRLAASKLGEAKNTVTAALASLVNLADLDPLQQKLEVGDYYDQKLDVLQLNLSRQGLTLAEVTNWMAQTLPSTTTRANYVRDLVLGQQQDASAVSAAAAFLNEFFQWQSGVYDNGGSSQNYFEFERYARSGNQLKATPYRLATDAKSYQANASTSGLAAGAEALSVAGAWKAVTVDRFADAAITVSQQSVELQFTAMPANLLQGRWKLSVKTQPIAGADSASVLDPLFTQGLSGPFDAMASRYVVSMVALEPSWVSSNTYANRNYTDLAQVRSAHAATPLCHPALALRFGGQGYGVVFSGSNAVALTPVDENCNKLDDGTGDLTLTWQTDTVAGRPAMLLGGGLLPEVSTYLGSLSGGYREDVSNPNLRFGTDQYQIFLSVEANGKLRLGYKLLPGAVVNANPDGGAYFNRAALQSLLKLVSYPTWVAP